MMMWVDALFCTFKELFCTSKESSLNYIRRISTFLSHTPYSHSHPTHTHTHTHTHKVGLKIDREEALTELAMPPPAEGGGVEGHSRHVAC